MGKRKKSSKAPQGPKKREPLATTFQCLFCNHEKSVSVKLERKTGIGQLSCKVCGQTFQTNINYLSAAVDVYADWIDACDAVAKETAGSSNKTTNESYWRKESNPRDNNESALSNNVENYDGFIVDDEADAEGEYAEDG